MYKKTGLGVTDFKELINGNYYYVDKTLLIKKILNSGSNQFYFIYPRMGKTLNLSMLQYFFEDTGSFELNEKNKNLFIKTNIYKEACFQTEACNNFVISLELPVTAPVPYDRTFNSLLQYWKKYFSSEFKKFNYVKSALGSDDRELFNRFINCKISNEELLSSISFLLQCIAAYYKKKCILIMDEFDINIICAKLDGFYFDFKTYYSLLLMKALQSDGLRFAIFAGQPLYDAQDFTLASRNKEYDSYFAYTEQEIIQVLSYYKRMDQYNFVKEWCGNYKDNLFHTFIMTEYLFHVIDCHGKQDEEELIMRWSPSDFFILTEYLLNNPVEYNKFEQLRKGGVVKVNVDSKEYEYMIDCGVMTIVSHDIKEITIRLSNNAMKKLIKQSLELHEISHL